MLVSTRRRNSPHHNLSSGKLSHRVIQSIGVIIRLTDQPWPARSPDLSYLIWTSGFGRWCVGIKVCPDHTEATDGRGRGASCRHGSFGGDARCLPSPQTRRCMRRETRSSCGDSLDGGRPLKCKIKMSKLCVYGELECLQVHKNVYVSQVFQKAQSGRKTL